MPGLWPNTTSAPADRLPFNVPVVPTPLRSIVEGYLRSAGYISWSHLHDEGLEEAQELTVEVWSVPVA
ncbi:hypothetical protein ACQHIV_25250 [Kribbella sp. GL6]|uniref:hypothetical protein n=1 Tax=Kribbella sp. GL6 TaxID=3419765 RepID=UPI003D01FC17